jgi:hypothetical protein
MLLLLLLLLLLLVTLRLTSCAAQSKQAACLHVQLCVFCSFLVTAYWGPAASALAAAAAAAGDVGVSAFVTLVGCSAQWGPHPYVFQ